MRILGTLIGRHARLILAAWALLVAVCFAASTGTIGTGLFDRLYSGAPRVQGEAHKADQILESGTKIHSTVMVSLTEISLTDPRVKKAFNQISKEVAGWKGVEAVQNPFDFPGGPFNPIAAPFVAQDKHGLLLSVQLDPDLNKVDARALSVRVVERLDLLDNQVPGSLARAGGVDVLIRAVTDQVQADLKTGEVIALPSSLVIMVVIFGGLLAAGLPLIGAVASIGGALLTLLGFSYVIELDASVVNVVTVLGLGLCIDYGLLMVSRFREELRSLATDPADLTDADLTRALATTLQTAGRTVLYSGVTVGISLAGLMWFRADILRAIGAAGASVVMVALLVALTLVPSLLFVAARKLAVPSPIQRLPLLNRLGDVPPASGVFSRLATRVQARPLLVILGVSGILLLLAWPVGSMRMVASGSEMLPATAPQRAFFDHLEQAYPIVANPQVNVVAQASITEVNAYADEIARDVRYVKAVNPPTPVGDPNTTDKWLIGIRTVDGNAADTTRAVVDQLRQDRPDFPTWVTGQTAQMIDYTQELRDRAPYAIAGVMAATFVLLFLMTGSLLIPAKALIMNVVSLGATLGVLVWVFQYGNLEWLLDFQSPGAIETTLPPLIIAFAFGLSMDYEVFLLSRIKERRDLGDDNDAAVRNGLQASGRIITSAACIIVVVFLGFVAGQLLVIKENGVAMAVAVIVDATLVRMLLVPATMTLLGEWNWWAPAPLQRLYERYGISEHGTPAVQGPAAP